MLRRGLVAKTIGDAAFDALYPTPIRAVSSRFWTPIEVAYRVAGLFEAYQCRRVLDVGSGPGKLCIVAAATTPRLSWTGVEHRTHLVAASRRAARRLRIPNVRFDVGDVLKARWSEFDAFYFFNPFGENIFVDEDHFDETVELSPQRFLAEILVVERMLLAARIGTTVVTYHGFGGRIPRSYTRLHEERCGTNLLRVWRKTQTGCPTDGYWREKIMCPCIQSLAPEG